jgi:hypothetical protein
MNHIRIYPPGHNDGHAYKWYWEVRSDMDIFDCGSSKEKDDAIAEASASMDISLLEIERE